MEGIAGFESRPAVKQHQMDILQTKPGRSPANDQLLTDLYTLIGCVRGSIAAMANAQDVINQINWRQWTMPRF